MTHEPKKGVRRYDVDWLRVIAVCVPELFHVGAAFIYEFVVRRTRVTPVLFGVKTRKPRRAGDLTLPPEAVVAAHVSC